MRRPGARVEQPNGTMKANRGRFAGPRREEFLTLHLRASRDPPSRLDRRLRPTRHRVAGAPASYDAASTAMAGESSRAAFTDQPLVSAGRVAADDADRVEPVHHFGDGEQLWHRAERLAAEVGVGAGDDHAQPAIGDDVTRSTMPASRNCASSIAMTCGVGSSSRAICSGVSTGIASVVRPSWLDTV